MKNSAGFSCATVVLLTQRFGTEAITGPKSIFSQMELMGYKVLPSTTEAHKEQRYVGGIDAIQLEIGTKLRARANLERTATDLAEAIAVFAQEYLPLVKSYIAIEATNSP
jgi:hypothetical protein